MWNPGIVVGMSVLALCALPAAQNTSGRVELARGAALERRNQRSWCRRRRRSIGRRRRVDPFWRDPRSRPCLGTDVYAAIARPGQASRGRARGDATGNLARALSLLEQARQLLRWVSMGPRGDPDSDQRAAGATPYHLDIGRDSSDLPADVNRLRAALIDVWNAAKPSCARRPCRSVTRAGRPGCN